METTTSLPNMPPNNNIDVEIENLLHQLHHILEEKREMESLSKKCRKLHDNSEHVLARLFTAIMKFKEMHKPIMYDPVFISILGDDTSYDIEEDLRQLQRHILTLKQPRVPKRQPCYYDAKPLEKLLSVLSKPPSKSTHQFVHETHVPIFFRNPTFENSAAFRDFEVRYNDLSPNLKLCLLCFSVFPVSAIIKKRLMVYWWMAEGFIEKGHEKDLEQLGAEYFDELLKKDFIKPYNYKRCLEVQTCKMPTFIHSAVTTIAARAKFFDFDSVGRPQADCPSSFRLAMVTTPCLENYKGYEKFHFVFNVSAHVLCLSPDWIRTMKNVSVLYLGRWQSYSNHQIRVTDDDFLMVLNNMKHLRLLSLQGILGIAELPDQVTQLKYLMILDLRACGYLQKLPHDIGLLKSLTHLDLSECYLLYWMPKGLSKLKNLLVLKGFVVGEHSQQHSKHEHTCSLKDLSALPKLRKLSIFARYREFPDQRDLEAFQQLRVLTKLKIEWGGLWGAKREDNNQVQKDDARQLTATLQKLELQSFPKKTAPDWLNPMKLKNLQKLYITGSHLCYLGGNIGGWNRPVDPWRVKFLRLRNMTGLIMHWKEECGSTRIKFIKKDVCV
ncbi:disease resistance RPP13-like protein 4 [Heracleum sosnowskyi]|uniref:Disease resistance RPP13-like protein 4 n=1 Tax=Heracleum sosnowskyi TaxID=360622 RepID=A0AAD8H288_9APIA|nr:disease resistance RPP13-like protein 4 [Heracleum sosnowskyi]